MLGWGIANRSEPSLFRQRRAVDLLEITLDHYLDASSENEQELKLLAEHFTLILTDSTSPWAAPKGSMKSTFSG